MKHKEDYTARLREVANRLNATKENKMGPGPTPSENPKKPNLLEPQAIVKVFVSTSSAPKESDMTVKQEGDTDNCQAEEDGKVKNGMQFFSIHKDFICFYSPFFSSAFNGTYEEGQTQCMTLYDIDIEAFGMYVNWVYQQKLPGFAEISESIHFVHLSKLWVLGKRFLTPSLQNKVMNKVHQLIMSGQTHKFKEFALFAYDLFGGNNELAKVAACAVAFGKAGFLELFTKGGFPPAMSIDVITALRTRQEHFPELHIRSMGDVGRYYVKE